MQAKTKQRIHQQFFEKLFWENTYFVSDLRIHFKWYKYQPKNTSTILWKCILENQQKYWSTEDLHQQKSWGIKVILSTNMNILILWHENSIGTEYKKEKDLHQQYFSTKKIDQRIHQQFFENLFWKEEKIF